MTEPMSEHVIRRQHFVAGVETGIKSERERIIKLLDTECECEQDHYCAYHRAITIILEESK
jgi:hypothetical protein